MLCMRIEAKNNSINGYVKCLGIGYVVIVFSGLFNTFFVKSGVYNVNTFLETADRFRMAQTIDIVMYCVVIWVSWSSYMVTKPVNKDLSLSILGTSWSVGRALDLPTLLDLGYVYYYISLPVNVYIVHYIVHRSVTQF